MSNSEKTDAVVHVAIAIFLGAAVAAIMAALMRYC